MEDCCCPGLWLSVLVGRYTVLKHVSFFRKRNLSGLYHLRRSIKFRSASRGEEGSTDVITWDGMGFPAWSWPGCSLENYSIISFDVCMWGVLSLWGSTLQCALNGF